MLRSGAARGIQHWVPRLAALALAACDPGEVGLADVAGHAPPPADTVYVRVSRPAGGPAADAPVRYLRMDVRDYAWQEQRTDAGGLAPLAPLAAGSLYWVVAEQENPTLQVLGGGEKVLGPTAGSVELPVPLSPPRRGTIVISEVYLQSPPPWEIGDRYYPYSEYLELANNSDQTIYLDGMLVGMGYTWWEDDSRWGHHACVDTEAMRNDSAGVWSIIMWRIPGAGTDHQLAPGAAAVLAFAAADHTRIHPSMLDLSHAEFEFGLKGAADNPSAANLELLGPHAPDGVAGASLSLVDALWFIAAPADVAAFPRAYDPGFSDRRIEYWRVPRELLLDVAFIWWDMTGGYFPQGDPVPCHDPVYRDFDRMPGGFLREDDLYLSAQRRSVVVDGRTMLLDTQTSAVDFIKAPRTPGRLAP